MSTNESLDQRSGFNFLASDHIRPKLHAAVVTPGPLDLNSRLSSNLSDQAEPSSELSLPPPGLEANSSFNLAQSEHFTAHQDLYSSRIEMFQHVLSFFLLKRYSQFILICLINV